MTKAEYWEKQALNLAKALAFYAEPETYFAIAFLPDPPCGEFMDDFSETDHLGQKPGKRAREALVAATKLEDENEALLKNSQENDGAIETLRTLINEVLDYNETPPMCRICRCDEEHEPSWCARKKAITRMEQLARMANVAGKLQDLT